MAEFIVIEGLDGTGKTTQIGLLAKTLESRGKKTVTTAEPTDLPSGKLLRRVLSGEVPSSPWSTAALFLADRIQHNCADGGIGDSLKNGLTVISDRYYYSTFAYQGSETDLKWTMDIHYSCPLVRRPDLVIFLTMGVDECLKRINANRPADAIEIYENAEALSRTKSLFEKVFDEIKERENVVFVDASGSVEEVHERIIAAYDGAFSEKRDS